MLGGTRARWWMGEASPPPFARKPRRPIRLPGCTSNFSFPYKGVYNKRKFDVQQTQHYRYSSAGPLTVGSAPAWRRKPSGRPRHEKPWDDCFRNQLRRIGFGQQHQERPALPFDRGTVPPFAVSAPIATRRLSSMQREYMETVKTSADSLLAVINDILDFSKLEAGKIVLEAADFHLREWLELTLKTLALRADEKGLDLLGEIAPEVPEFIKADANRLRQILLNLAGNAIKFTQKGEVVIKVQKDPSSEGNQLRFTVSDTGIGIAAEKLELIFQPFSQADTSTTREYGGTGLGLSSLSK
jgi:hypothetical protein